MRAKSYFTQYERAMLPSLVGQLASACNGCISDDEYHKVKRCLINAAADGRMPRNNFDMNPIIQSLQTAYIVATEIRNDREALLAILLHTPARYGFYDGKMIAEDFGESVATIINGLIKTNEVYQKSPVVESDNFKDLIMSFASDMRVILIMIADRVNIMRQIRDTANVTDREKVSNEAKYLYAPLAHKLGLYKLKTELEDLSVKYLYHDIYYAIKDKLNQTKAARDRYIAKFIAPVEQRLKQSGLKFHIKGRTKSIHSIWNKMKKQNVEFEGIYDLFAIRIILDSQPEDEKKDCWVAYSIVTDMYPPNPKRLRDWLSVPKSNGYESLHITVMGPEGKWVEVQIRTERMDEIAERGLAAHWRYKGIKSENEMDGWLTSIREALESNTNSNDELIDQFKVNLYKDNVFIFTPKGDLIRMPKGSTLLDFAFSIHSNIGSHCTGGKVNGKIVPIRHRLSNGDQVEVLTSPSQLPKQDWLAVAVTSKARSKIRQVLKENANKQANLAKEALQRKFKNRKIEADAGLLSKLIATMGFKDETLFYQAVGEGRLDANTVVDRYIEATNRQSESQTDEPQRSAGSFDLHHNANHQGKADGDILLIDKDLKGLDYKLAKCCNPIYGDDIFAYTTSGSGIKIHRTDCPNAKTLHERYGYRILKAKWNGETGKSQFDIILKVVGQDNIGIVTNMTGLINKETDTVLRSISITSNDGMFSGMMTISVRDKSNLDNLIKKLKAIRGVMQIERS